jgi:hypothetical protein
MLDADLLAAEGVPVLVIIKVCSLIQRVLNGAHRTLTIRSQSAPKQSISGHLDIEFGPESAIVFENVGVAPRPIRHIVKRGRLLHGRWRIILVSAVTVVILLQLHTVMAHHATLVHLIQGAIIEYDLHIATAAISKIINMLGIESSLQICHIQIGLILVRMIHILVLSQIQLIKK